MTNVVPERIFSGEAKADRSWSSYATSVLVHAAIIALLFLITVPVLEDQRDPTRVSVVTPLIAPYRPKTIQRPVILRAPIVRTEAKPRISVPVLKPVKAPEVKTQILAAAPEIRAAVPTVTPSVPAPKLDVPAPPKPQVHTNVFASAELAKGAKAPAQIKVGGFGDPNSVPTAEPVQQARLVMPKTGSFDMAAGEGNSGGGGSAARGAVRSAGFGSGEASSGVTNGTGTRGTVRSSGFGDPAGSPGGTGTGARGGVRTAGFSDGATPAVSAPDRARPVTAPSTTPVEILYKPKPAYTPEAKSLKLEGQVSLSVVFTADGSVKVVHVVRGLGHGLDEAAEQAAAQVRFRPATRGGVPIDTSATIYITFEMT